MNDAVRQTKEHTAEQIEAAIAEGVAAFNVARRADMPAVYISRRALYLLVLGAAQGYGVVEYLRFFDREQPNATPLEPPK